MRLLPLLLLSVGCTPNIQPLKIAVQEPQWVVTDFRGAREVWAGHGIQVDLVDDTGEVTVRVGELDNNGGMFSWHQITLDPDVENGDKQGQICLVAHEIGHAIGMRHVSDKFSLMYGGRSVLTNGCWWSEEDQQELDSIQE